MSNLVYLLVAAAWGAVVFAFGIRSGRRRSRLRRIYRDSPPDRLTDGLEAAIVLVLTLGFGMTWPVSVPVALLWWGTLRLLTQGTRL